MEVAKLCRVSGRVQGVYFRASTQQQAQRLGVCGYAKNLIDGRVEVLAVGGAEQVGELLRWLWQGPPLARVTDIEVTDVIPTGLAPVPTAFTTG